MSNEGGIEAQWDRWALAPKEGLSRNRHPFDILTTVTVSMTGSLSEVPSPEAREGPPRFMRVSETTNYVSNLNSMPKLG